MKELIKKYEQVTGNKMPNNQIALHEWSIDYHKWIEKQLFESEQYLDKIKEVAEIAYRPTQWNAALECIKALVDEYKNSKS